MLTKSEYELVESARRVSLTILASAHFAVDSEEMRENRLIIRRVIQGKACSVGLIRHELTARYPENSASLDTLHITDDSEANGVEIADYSLGSPKDVAAYRTICWKKGFAPLARHRVLTGVGNH